MKTSLSPRRLCRYCCPGSQFPHQPRPFSSGKALRLSTSLPFQSSACCQVSSLKAEGFSGHKCGIFPVFVKTGGTFYSLERSVSVCGIRVWIFQRRFGDGIYTLQLHTAVHDTFWVTAVIYKEVFGFIIPPYILIRGGGLM